MDQIITFDKSLQQRFQEYWNIFEGVKPLSYSKIDREWASYLELGLDPSGWQAIWKIPRVKCEQLRIPFPSVVLVYVIEIQYTELIALVRVLSTQDDISISDKHFVELSQLWVTKEQDKSIALNLESTANMLDQLRFFYIHLLRPWDNDLDDCIDWRDKYLLARLRLYYDLKNNRLPKVTAGRIYCLINEAKRLESKRDILEEQIDEEKTDLQVLDSSHVVTNDKNAEILLGIYVRMTEIKNEMELLEDPVSRSVIIKRHEALVPRKNIDESSVWLVFNEGTADEYIKFLQKLKEHYPDQPLTFTTDLQAKMEAANTDDVFVLKNSRHTIKGGGAIVEDWTIEGIDSCDETSVVSEIHDVMFDFIGENAVVKNLTIDARSTQCAMLVRNGKVLLKNCKIFGSGQSSTIQGIIVLAGAELHLIDCTISRFAVGIVGNSSATIKLQNCSLHDTNVGLKLYDDCVVTAENTTFQNCKEYGVVVETERDTFEEEKKVTTFDSLNIIPDLKTQAVTGKNNVKGDVIVRKQTLKAMDDLFADPDVDPTVIVVDDSLIELSDLDEEMDTEENNDKSIVDNGVHSAAEEKEGGSPEV